MKENRLVTEYIEKAPAIQRNILKSLRELIHKSVPDTVEEFKWGQPIFKKNKDFCYLKSTKDHVNLGFFNFQNLRDHDNLLEGTGKQMRHVKLKSVEDIQPKLFSEWFKSLIKQL